MIKRLFLYLLLLSINILFSHGFAPSTLVKMWDGTHQSLEKVCNKISKKQNVVVASTDHRYITSQQITCAGISSTNCYIRLGFDDGYDEFCQDDVVCTPLQEFYVPGRGGWTPAYMLRPGDLVAAYDGKMATVTFVQGVPRHLRVYTICVPETQIFFVGKHSVMVHNTELALVWSCAPAITSFWTGTAVGSFLAGPAGVLAGVAACCVALVVQALVRKSMCAYKPCTHSRDCLPKILRAENNNQKNKCSVFSASVSPQGNNQKNGDEDDKEKHPNGIYKDAGYHHQNSAGHKSPAPRNGQKALDNSVQIKSTSKMRVGVGDGEIVILRHTVGSEYHGYVIRWNEIARMSDGEKIKSILQKNNWVNKKGIPLV